MQIDTFEVSRGIGGTSMHMLYTPFISFFDGLLSAEANLQLMFYAWEAPVELETGQLEPSTEAILEPKMQ